MSRFFNVEFAQEKVSAALQQVRKLKAVDFPYQEPAAALSALEALYRADQSRLSWLLPTDAAWTREECCYQANHDVAEYHKVLGFILRSTNVRNAFEVYEPLLRLSRKVCGPHARLILSSEWTYSPFTYPAVFKNLPDLIFIGLPATEAENSLIIPLAGHELGHSVWRMPRAGRRNVKAPIGRKLENAITAAYISKWDEFKEKFKPDEDVSEIRNSISLREFWSRSYALAERHCEELLCDILGLRIFGESYLYSFMYLICPHLGARLPNYPPLNERTNLLVKVANTHNITLPENFLEHFSEPDRDSSARDKFVLDVADAAVGTLWDDIIKEVNLVLSSTGGDAIVFPNDDERDRIERTFLSLTPATGCRCLADIINAGWKVRTDVTAWHGYGFSPERKREVLNDLVLKTIEVMEFEARVSNA